MRDETTETIDTFMDVQQAMALLTERQRQALTLTMGGYGQVEIAGCLGVTQSAVSQLLAGARGTMRVLLA